MLLLPVSLPPPPLPACHCRRCCCPCRRWTRRTWPRRCGSCVSPRRRPPWTRAQAPSTWTCSTRATGAGRGWGGGEEGRALPARSHSPPPSLQGGGRGRHARRGPARGHRARGPVAAAHRRRRHARAQREEGGEGGAESGEDKLTPVLPSPNPQTGFPVTRPEVEAALRQLAAEDAPLISLQEEGRGSRRISRIVRLAA